MPERNCAFAPGEIFAIFEALLPPDIPVTERCNPDTEPDGLDIEGLEKEEELEKGEELAEKLEGTDSEVPLAACPPPQAARFEPLSNPDKFAFSDDAPPSGDEACPETETPVTLADKTFPEIEAFTMPSEGPE